MITSRTKVITLNNQKGGVGKTTVTLNLAYQFAKKGYRSLLVDLDPQGNIGTSLGYDSYKTEADDEDLYVYNHIENLLEPRLKPETATPYTYEEIKEYIYTPTYISRKRLEGNKWGDVEIPFGFDVMLNTSDLSIIDLKMALYSQGKINPFFVSDMIECIKEQKIYDYIIIDTPPALGSLSVNSIAAAVDGIIIPSTLELNSFKGIDRLADTIDSIKNICEKTRNIQHRGILGIALTAFRSTTNVDKELREYVVQFFPIPTFKTQIRESSDARKASASGYLFSQLNDKGDADFYDLANEIELSINNKEEWEKQTEEFYNKIKDEK